MTTLFDIEPAETVGILAPMSETEARRCADDIRSGIVNVGRKLLELYERDGWQVLGYSSWRECAQVEFGFKQSHAYRLLEAAETERNISPIGEIQHPIPESHLRPLTHLEPEAQREAWQEAVETAPNGRVTAAHVEATVRRFVPADAPAPVELVPVPVSLRDDYDSDEWYTPVEYVDAVRWVFCGVIDLDPASCNLAQTTVQAIRFFDKGQDALSSSQSWQANNVFLNPPYSAPLCEQFVERFVREYERGSFPEGIALVNNATETQWFQNLLSLPEVQVCFPARRLRFWRHDHGDVGARQGQAIFYVGPNGVEFRSRFGRFGKVLAG